MSATAKIMAWMGLDNSGFTKGVDGAEKRTHAFGKSLDGMKGKIAAAFSVAAVAAAVKNVASSASDIADAAENLSITTDEFQALTLSAKQFGIESEAVSMALGRMAKTQAEFVSGGASETLKKQMEALGVSIDQADVMNAAQFFEAVSAGAQKSSDGLSAALDLMGKSGPKFQALMKLTAGIGLGGMIAGSKSSGEMVSEKDIKAIDNLVDGLIQSAKNKAMKLGSVIVGAMSGSVGNAKAPLTVDQQAIAERNKHARDIADQESAAKVSADAAEIRKKNAYELMSTEGKILQIRREMNELDKQAAAASSLTAKAELDKTKAELEGKLQGLDVTAEHNQQYDQLTRIGAGVFSGTADTAVKVQNKQVKIQEKMLAELTHVKDAINKRPGGKF